MGIEAPNDKKSSATKKHRQIKQRQELNKMVSGWIIIIH